MRTIPTSLYRKAASGEDNELRLYDEVIVEGSNLQDGKLL